VSGGGGSAGGKCLVTVILDCSVTESIGITVIAASAITAAADLISVILIASPYSCLQLLRLQLFVTGTFLFTDTSEHVRFFTF